MTQAGISSKIVLFMGSLLAASCLFVLTLIQNSSEQAVLDTAYDGAKSLALATNIARVHYSEASVSRIQSLPSINVSADYRKTTHAIPNPATFAIELARKLSDNSNTATVRMYSNFPFPGRRATGGPHNTIEQQALMLFDQEVGLHQRPVPFSKVVHESNKKVLYYIEPIIMTKTCVACHNTAETSPKSDWKVGDVRGAISVRQELIRSMAMQEILNWGYLGLSGVWLLSVLGIWFVHYRIRLIAKEKSERYSRLADTDSLTQLLNRRGFDHAYMQCWQACLQESKSLAILYCDVDDFKGINDRFGHAAGDDSLIKLAEQIKSQLRSKTDIAARWGGDEFVIILQGADLTKAAITAERISNAVSNNVINPQVTISIGVSAAIPNSKMTAPGLLKMADKALYRAKENLREAASNSEPTRRSD